MSEILPLPRLWRPPGAPASLAGVLNFKGTPVPVVSMRELLGVGIPLSDIYQHILLMREGSGERSVALLVDRVIDVVAAEDAKPQPVSTDETLNGCIEAELPLADGTLAHILAADRILMEEEKVRLAQIQDAAQARRAAWDVANDA